MSFKILTAVCFAVLLASAHAESITYTESAIASGSLNGVSFKRALVTITATGDTSDVFESSPGIYQIAVELQGTVDGVGMFSLAGNYFSNQPYSGAGPTGPDPKDNDILDTYNAAFANYDLTTAIGPINGLSIINAGHKFKTSDGIFVLDRSGRSTFQATLGPAVTPEPASLLLLGTGLVGGVIARRRAVRRNSKV